MDLTVSVKEFLSRTYKRTWNLACKEKNIIFFLILGIKCDLCVVAYFNLSDSNSLGCTACNCNPMGSLSQFCNPDDGKCSCQSNIIGRQCDECEDGFYSFDDGCLKCECNEKGTVPNSYCNKDTGQCECKEFISGLSCNVCEDGAYGFASSAGCVKCTCLAAGTLNSSSTCDEITGECLCKANVVGTNCNQCKLGFWGISADLEEGCQSCDCNETGTQAGETCEQNTGNCSCLANRIGRRCEDCARGRLK